MIPSPGNDLVDRVRGGEVAAAEALFAVYTPYLRAIVRRQLADRMRPKFDSLDVVQSVWVQVVRQLRRDGWNVENEGQLRALLATIARRRLVSRVRREGGAAPPLDWEALPGARDPRPSEAVQADDLWAKMLDLCPPEHHSVLVLKRQGLPLAEIATRTGLHEGSVRRIIRRLSRALAVHENPLDPVP